MRWGLGGGMWKGREMEERGEEAKHERRRSWQGEGETEVGRKVNSNKTVGCRTFLEFIWKLCWCVKGKKKVGITLCNLGFTPACPLVSGFGNLESGTMFLG